jgi:pyruvate, water dikinase
MRASEHISWFADLGLEHRASVGGKGGSLGELLRAHIAVPAGFVVTTSAFTRCLEALERDAPVRSAIESLPPDDLARIAHTSRALRSRIEQAPLPAGVLDAIASAHARLCADRDPAVAVRSSATTEDAADASFAGLQDTYLWIKGAAETARMVQHCWASLYSVESISYRLQRRIPEHGVAMAVVVQIMVDARSAGVMFTRSPTTGDRSVITVEGGWGLGSAVVGGEVTPDRWVIGKITGEISTRAVSDKTIQHVPRDSGGTVSLPVPDDMRRAACMSDEELQRLRDIGRRVERHYGRAQDIEWAVERSDGQILLLQSRPETVWSTRDAAPVARAVDNPLQHVMSIFGGRS